MITEEARAREVLKPCPFCGATDGRLVQVFTRATEDFAFWSVECLDCGCEIADDESQERADAAWNTRPTATGGAEMREAAAKVADEEREAARTLLTAARRAGDRDGTLVHREAASTATSILARIRALPVESASASGEVEKAWRDGWNECKGRLTEDEAFCLTEDVEEDAWLDSTTRASLQPREREGGVSDVNDISDEELVRRVIQNACVSPLNRRVKTQPLWESVSRRFGLGSTYSGQLCRRFGFDPNQDVRP